MKAGIILLLMVTCLPTFSGVAQTQEEVEWLNRQILPLQSTEPGEKQDDLQPFLNMVSNARIVALGECTHGSREVFQTKHRLIKALIENKGFVIFAIEADYTGAQIVNDYVHTGKGDSLQVLDALGYWTWYTDEVWQLIKWIKVYNQTHTPKISFTGFDMNVPFPAIRAIHQFATQQSNTDLIQWSDQLDTLYRHINPKSSDGGKQGRNIAIRIYRMLEELRVPPSLLQSAHTLVQYTEMKSKGFHQGNMFRDKCMADNINWLLEQAPNAKLILWAHNGHIERRGGLSKSTGYYVSKKYGIDYLSVGFATGYGTCTAINLHPESGKRTLTRANELVEPIAGSFENWFSQASAPDFYMDLRNVPVGLAETQWLIQKGWMRNIGSTMPTKPEHQFTPNHRLRRSYDVLIFLRRTSASHSYIAK